MRKGSVTILAAILMAISSAAMAEEKIVWSPENNIGKNKTWVKGAVAEVEGNLLKMSFSDADWCGVGLNWEGYWPEDAGIDVTSCKNLVIEFKASGAQASSLSVSLKDNKHKKSADARLKKYCPDENVPSEFITIKIPISDLLTEKSEMETKVAWEIMFGLWSQDTKDVTVELKKVSFEK